MSSRTFNYVDHFASWRIVGWLRKRHVEPAEGAALAYYHAAAEALEAAERARLASRPTPELADERRRLRRTLAASPAPAQFDKAAAAVDEARAGLAAAEAERARATERLEELTAARRRRNPQGIEMARRSVRAAGQRSARAQVELDRAQARAAALHDQAPALEAVRQRLEAVDAALSVQVGAASRHRRLISPRCWASPTTAQPPLAGTRRPPGSRPTGTTNPAAPPPTARW